MNIFFSTHFGRPRFPGTSSDLMFPVFLSLKIFASSQRLCYLFEALVLLPLAIRWDIFSTEFSPGSTLYNIFLAFFIVYFIQN